MTTDKIYLVGFMASGKTTVARALARTLNWTLADTDRRIEASEGCSIADVFASKGEAYFRDAERQVLQDLLALRRTVVSTGGGTFVAPANRATINADGTSVWLDVSFETIMRRIPSDGRRPLANDEGAMGALWHDRRPAYAHAHVHVDANALPVPALVRQIVNRISRAS